MEEIMAAGNMGNTNQKESFFKRHWIDILSFIAVLVGIGFIIAKNRFGGSVIDWIVAVASIICSAGGVWQLGSTDKKEANRYSRDKLLAAIAYFLSVIAIVVLSIH